MIFTRPGRGDGEDAVGECWGKQSRMTLLAVLIGVGAVSGCAQAVADEQDGSANGNAAKVERVAGSDVPRIELSDAASKRLGLTTGVVSQQPSGAIEQLEIPFSAVVYDPNGKPFAYTVVRPGVYTRVPLVVDDVRDDVALLDDGPAPGARVVTTGAQELWGAETGVGGES